MSTIFTFPPELKVHLFKYFTLYEQLQLRLLSRQWKAMIEEVGSFKTELGIVSQYTEENTAFNSLKLSNRRRFDDEPLLLSPDGAHFLSTIFPNITKATFNLNQAEYSQPNCFNLDILLQWAPNLTYLNFNMFCFRSESALITPKCAQLLAIIRTLPALTHLHLTNMHNILLPEPFPVLSRLEELKLHGYSIEHLAQVLRQVSPSLTSLTVEKLPDKLPESTITKLSSSLTKLTIYGWKVQNGASFIANLRRLQGLTVLDLSDVSNLNELHFSDLMTALVDLPHLHTVSLKVDLLYNKIKPPYSFLAHLAVRELYIESDDKLGEEMLKLSLFAYAFPNVNKVTIAAYDVHQRRPFLRIDYYHPTLENYVKRHFGEQIEVKLVNIGHLDKQDESDSEEEDETDADNEIAAHDDVHQVRRFFHIDVGYYRIFKNIDLGQILKNEEEDYDADNEDEEDG